MNKPMEMIEDDDFQSETKTKTSNLKTIKWSTILFFIVGVVSFSLLMYSLFRLTFTKTGTQIDSAQITLSLSQISKLQEEKARELAKVKAHILVQNDEVYKAKLLLAGQEKALQELLSQQDTLRQEREELRAKEDEVINSTRVKE